ncbi:MAG: hypothetical protein KDD82_27810 [Planctomycetes bacterium]|nr:hypothetical protein [Planctomycetota bacterium]
MKFHTSQSASAPPGTRLGGVYNPKTKRYEFAWVKPRIGGGIYDVWRVEKPSKEPELHLSANLIVPE